MVANKIVCLLNSLHTDIVLETQLVKTVVLPHLVHKELAAIHHPQLQVVSFDFGLLLSFLSDTCLQALTHDILTDNLSINLRRRYLIFLCIQFQLLAQMLSLLLHGDLPIGRDVVHNNLGPQDSVWLFTLVGLREHFLLFIQERRVVILLWLV